MDQLYLPEYRANKHHDHNMKTFSAFPCSTMELKPSVTTFDLKLLSYIVWHLHLPTNLPWHTSFSALIYATFILAKKPLSKSGSHLEDEPINKKNQSTGSALIGLKPLTNFDSLTIGNVEDFAATGWFDSQRMSVPMRFMTNTAGETSQKCWHPFVNKNQSKPQAGITSSEE